MPERIPQSVAIRVPIQAFLASDHVTPATGKTIAVTISKNGAAYGNPSGGATNATQIGSGSYYVDLSTIDTGTGGPLFVKGTEGTIDNIIAIYNVVGAHNAGFDGIPPAAADGAGGLPVSAAGGLDLDEMNADIEAIQAFGAPPSANTNATALLDLASGCETNYTVREALRVMLSALGGKLGITGPIVTIRDVNDTVDRITATTDAQSQRTAVTLDVS